MCLIRMHLRGGRYQTMSMSYVYTYLLHRLLNLIPN